MTPIVLVGGRDGALAAAERLGLHTTLITETLPPKVRREQLAGLWVTSFDAPPAELLAGAARALPQLSNVHPPAAVVALTEKSVGVAAWLRQHWGVPGNSVSTAELCRDKLLMKRHACAHHIACAEFTAVDAASNAALLARTLGFPLVLKPTDASGSRGTRFVRSLSDLPPSLSPGLIAESLVHGLEMSVESFVAGGQIQFTNLTEYLLPLWANVVPASLLPDHERLVRDLNRRVVESFGVERGMTHLEVFLTPTGPIFGELAVRPPGGQLMRLIESAYGFDPWEAALRCELGLPLSLPPRAQAIAGVWFLHPGAGQIASVQGVAAAARVPNIHEVSCRAKPGDVLKARAGSGESIGHVMARGAQRDEVVRALQIARRRIWIELLPVQDGTANAQ